MLPSWSKLIQTDFEVVVTTIWLTFAKDLIATMTIVCFPIWIQEVQQPNFYHTVSFSSTNELNHTKIMKKIMYMFMISI